VHARDGLSLSLSLSLSLARSLSLALSLSFPVFLLLCTRGNRVGTLIQLLTTAHCRYHHRATRTRSLTITRGTSITERSRHAGRVAAIRIENEKKTTKDENTRENRAVTAGFRIRALVRSHYSAWGNFATRCEALTAETHTITQHTCATCT